MRFPTEKHLQEFQMDKFGYESLSKVILNEILLEMELPNCFGLYGNWGSGKSTMLHFIKKHLEGNQDVKPVYFEPWKYEYADQKDLLFALLNCIKKECGIDSDTWKKVMVDALVIGSGLLRFSQIVDVKDVCNDAALFEEKIFKEHGTWIDKVEEFKSTFEVTLGKALKKAGASKLLIFVDDLDRCLPENAVRLLEGIKNFLSVENTLFVLAIDRRVMSEMIEKKYGLHQGYGDEYLMKIIHYYYELPTIDLNQIVIEVLTAYGIKFTERQSGYISEFLKGEAKEPRIAKHVLYQFGMNVSISKAARKMIEKDTGGKQLQYMFVAAFLLIRFPKIFSISNVKGLLINIRDFAVLSIDNNSEKYKNIIGRDESITVNDRKRLETIIQYGINTGNESDPEKLIDVTMLYNAIMILKKI